MLNCGAVDNGYCCTSPKSHEGDHRATTPHGECVWTWRQAGNRLGKTPNFVSVLQTITKEKAMARFEVGEKVTIKSKRGGIHGLGRTPFNVGDVVEITSRDLVKVEPFRCEYTERTRNRKYEYGVEDSCGGNWYFWYEDFVNPLFDKEETMTYCKGDKYQLTMNLFRRAGACADRLAELSKQLILMDVGYTNGTKLIPLTTLLNKTSESDQKWLLENGFIKIAGPTIEKGDYVRLMDRHIASCNRYIFALVAPNHFNLINLDTGDRWTNTENAFVGTTGRKEYSLEKVSKHFEVGMEILEK
jgi:hypothetical protein